MSSNDGQDEMETDFGKNYVTVYTQYNYGEVYSNSTTI